VKQSTFVEQGAGKVRGNRRVARRKNVAYRKDGRCSHVLTSVMNARSISSTKRWTLRIPSTLVKYARDVTALSMPYNEALLMR